MMSRTVRELGGEIWAELTTLIQESRSRGDSTFVGYGFEALGETIDLTMAVLARHTGQIITNDEDMPVKPLPIKQDSDY